MDESMPNRNHRPQKAEQIALEDTRPLVVNPLEGLDDRLRNPKDIEPDTAAMRNGIEHGGVQENRADTLVLRGNGGRKRSGAFGRHRAGRDLSKRR
jgi:hypothetical protein